MRGWLRAALAGSHRFARDITCDLLPICVPHIRLSSANSQRRDATATVHRRERSSLRRVAKRRARAVCLGASDLDRRHLRATKHLLVSSPSSGGAPM